MFIQNTESLLSTIIQLQIISTKGQQTYYTTWIDYHSNDDALATHSITHYPACVTQSYIYTTYNTHTETYVTRVMQCYVLYMTMFYT